MLFCDNHIDYTLFLELFEEFFMFEFLEHKERFQKSKMNSNLYKLLFYSVIPSHLQQVKQLPKSMFQDLTSVVIDIGTYKSKIGYGGDDAPKIIANSYLSKNSSMDVEGSNKYIVGDKYLNMERQNRDIQSIFKRKDGEMCQIDFQKYQPFLEFILNDQLQIDIANYSMLLSEDISYKPYEMRHNRQKIAEFIFQRLGAPNIYFLKNPVLSCFATGRSTALVCDSGETYTKVVSVHDGYCLYKSSRSIPYAGATLTSNIRKLVEHKVGGKVPTRFNNFPNITQSFRQYHVDQVIRDIKKSFASKQTQEGIQDINSIQYELPDHHNININKPEIHQKILSNEIQIIKGYSFKGVPSMITDNINSCDIDIKKELYSNILLTGGNMLFSNTMQQILTKISELAPPNAKVKNVAMVAPQQRIYSGWIGGSIVTSLSSFQSYWVGKEEWKEHGASIIEKKCN